ncbi:MAG: HRDC domain-containing protein [Deltaproteobacteria bacterium]|nr:HRDC domain-containing protein [Deltaproteobacteria bacterium]
MTPAREPSEVAAIAEALARAELVTFDLEFLAQDRLIPTLCLVQVSWVEHRELDADGREIVAPPRIALVDPLAVDVGPVVQALAAHPRVVAHAARQDLWVLAARFGAVVPGLVDTQVMAAFAGIGDQVGLAALANELLGLQLGKELQWTDWGTRPLSPAQLAYAADDVRHLPAIYGLLAKRLANRMPWAVAESAGVMSDALAAASVTPETAWRHVGGLRGIDADTHAAVVALAAWRQRVAIELDRPLGQIVNDKILVELARTRPSDPDAVRAHKGVTRLARDRAADILAAIAAAEPAKEPHAIRPWRAASLRAQRWAEVLLAIAHAVAHEAGVAPRLLATRADAEEFARVVDEQGLDAAAALPALATWRREVIGHLWTGWLAGTVVLAGDMAAPTGLAIIPAKI